MTLAESSKSFLNFVISNPDTQCFFEFTTVRVNDPGLVKDLDEHKISYSGHQESKFLSNILSWILPMGFFS